ncbi:hypothetical protein ACEZCY_10495 [Streptacidiphilus sp. N1-12]|uniref:Uncharacterized protein n=2 Tax=Streptacidiphilus alkalitolerans TaxID=3342712 RepID=A0ABV6V6N5_9ACTN
MNRQVKRWIQAAGAVAGTLVLTSFWTLYQDWQITRLFSGSGRSGPSLWEGLAESLLWPAIQAAVILGLLVLTLLISRLLLRGRFRIIVAGLLLSLAVFLGNWFYFDGAIEGSTALIFGFFDLANRTALAMAAGGWILRDRAPKPERDGISAEILGDWDAPGGVIAFASDGVFTLARAGEPTTAGLWEPLPGTRPQIVLRVDADTELGHGWQATVMDLESNPYGAVLRAGAAEYRRRDPEVVLERSPEYAGYIGAVEILEG